MNILGQRIKIQREELELTREELANKIGVSYSAIAMYERGEREPNNSLTIKMCELFNCSMDYILGISSYKNTQEKIKINQSLLAILDKLTPFDIDRLEKIIDESFDSSGQCVKKDLYLTELFHVSYLTSEEISFVIKNLCIHFKENYQLYPFKQNFHHFNILLFKDLVRLDFDAEYRNYNITQVSPDMQYYECPVYGQISTGQHMLAKENIERYLPVDPNIYGMSTPDGYFYLKISDNSMNKIIAKDTYVLIKIQNNANAEDIVLVSIDDKEPSIRKCMKLDKDVAIFQSLSDEKSELELIMNKQRSYKILGKMIGQTIIID